MIMWEWRHSAQFCRIFVGVLSMVLDLVHVRGSSHTHSMASTPSGVLGRESLLTLFPVG